jgi:hypothetical protein
VDVALFEISPPYFGTERYGPNLQKKAAENGAFWGAVFGTLSRHKDFSRQDPESSKAQRLSENQCSKTVHFAVC